MTGASSTTVSSTLASSTTVSSTLASSALSAFFAFGAAFAVAFVASLTTACFGESGSRTISITARGALSPLRGPIFVMRV